jgi:GrpB-like predicted nucleotidyltransferase (UPF0157 family)
LRFTVVELADTLASSQFVAFRMGHMRQQRSVIIVAYDPAWAERFREEASRIASVFGGDLLSIHHIGSTSIPG